MSKPENTDKSLCITRIQHKNVDIKFNAHDTFLE